MKFFIIEIKTSDCGIRGEKFVWQKGCCLPWKVANCARRRKRPLPQMRHPLPNCLSPHHPRAQIDKALEDACIEKWKLYFYFEEPQKSVQKTPCNLIFLYLLLFFICTELNMNGYIPADIMRSSFEFDHSL